MKIKKIQSVLRILFKEAVSSVDPKQLIQNSVKVETRDGLDYLVIAGGEPTVEVTGSGVGGRNQELALAFAINMKQLQETNKVLDSFDVVLLCAGTDGIDGPTDVAGAFGYAGLIDQAQSQGLDPCAYLKNNDSYNFFSRLNNGADFIKTGHTGTNVMDVHVIVIAERVCRCRPTLNETNDGCTSSAQLERHC